jgi:hypothetical protein
MTAFEAGAEIADTVRTSGVAVPANRLLVIALEGLATSDLSAVAHQSVFYRLPENPVTAQVPGSEEYRLAVPVTRSLASLLRSGLRHRGPVSSDKPKRRHPVASE